MAMLPDKLYCLGGWGGTSPGLIIGVLPSSGAGAAMPWSPVAGGFYTPPQSLSFSLRPPPPGCCLPP